MKKLTIIVFVWCFSIAHSLTQEGAKEKTFVGKISDNMCGLKHTMMEGKSDKECTLACIKMEGKFVLADEALKVVYRLDDQKTPEQFAGQIVKVTGTLDTKSKSIRVSKIEAAGEKKP